MNQSPALPASRRNFWSTSDRSGFFRATCRRLGPDVYLLTRRLSRDRLEATFGLVRVGGGPNTNRTPTDAMSRLRLLSLLMLASICWTSPQSKTWRRLYSSWTKQSERWAASRTRYWTIF